RIFQITYTVTDVEQVSNLAPDDYELQQNYPNPFNPSTSIEYTIPSESFVELKVYDILGNEVATLVNEQQQAGVYRADFTADNLPSGMYFARITANSFTRVVKMILLK
ncbi:MAG: T9SS type A sorting domain-containing protein, partial [Bacteroidetes bacterium]|nr:T9SS type A sorting domain-containing protein [Bacteroidota bacterium]